MQNIETSQATNNTVTEDDPAAKVFLLLYICVCISVCVYVSCGLLILGVCVFLSVVRVFMILLPDYVIALIGIV